MTFEKHSPKGVDRKKQGFRPFIKLGSKQLIPVNIFPEIGKKLIP